MTLKKAIKHRVTVGGMRKIVANGGLNLEMVVLYIKVYFLCNKQGILIIEIYYQ
ncbi:hypothetical protein DSM107010_42400 [Chroococcidiopsis cubana SAG 39.79]|uniref:Uncharacterized protein n=1 Tax=Chroococcidiopsis cubana SAG 39.79 TaxID=388085 RepID=A0AB37UFV1_9CYAN|nr:hypothetical protein DSM107010_42400 [Chroococcidiopsis cubana SAG 39.79]